MPSAPADDRPRTGRPREWAAAGLVLLVVLVLVTGGILLVRRGVVEESRPRAGTADSGTTGATGTTGPDRRDRAVAALLDRLPALLERGSASQVAALAAPGDRAARRELATLRHNVRVLRVADLSLHSLPGSPAPSGAAADRSPGRQAWVGRVEVAWRLRGTEAHPSRLEVAMAFRGAGGSVRFVSVRPPGEGRLPLWLLDRVSTRRTRWSLVVVAGNQSVRRFSGLAARAVVEVRRVLPGWRGHLVVEVPPDQRTLSRVLGSAPGAYAGTAAVTTTVDGSVLRSAPVHVFVNPRVLDPLGPRGSQVVVSHEATHVTTHAATSSLPGWLSEGFADYVALDHVDVPVTRAASQILALVARTGAPDHLPEQADLDAGTKDVGAAYESAWLACRLLARQHGERRLVAFYRASDRASSTTEAFRSVLGTDQQTFTRSWRSDLARLSRSR